MMDASTLGKIDIQGPDSAWLLNMVYTNAWNKLDIGRCRYGLMLNEHGMVFDDGVTTRIGENHYHMTTTTGGAARVLTWLEEWLQTERPDKKVYCTSVTEQWAVAAINGPAARDLLSELTDMPLDSESFPFMAVREGIVAGIPARVFRISFSGELSYEINVPAHHGLYLWEQLIKHGAAHGLCPYGTESMHVLRAEKGFIIVGQDTDGSVTPGDLGMDWIVSKKKADFIGKRSLSRSSTARAGRKQLVGLLTEDPGEVLPEGTHIVAEARDKPPMPMLGHVTSSYMSPNVGRSIAMALLRDGRNRMGDRVSLKLMDGRTVTATVADPVFYDKEGAKARG
jgi:sarcosine oxidase subunit alpha